MNMELELKGGIHMELTVYLAGQIHDNWREEVAEKAKEKIFRFTLWHHRQTMTGRIISAKKF